MFCFPNTGHVQISSYSRAFLRIICKKTKGQVPLGPLFGKENPVTSERGLLVTELFSRLLHV